MPWRDRIQVTSLVEFAMTVRKVLIAGGAAQARHALEVEHYTYRRELKELVRRFAKAASAPRPSRQPSLPAVR